MREYSLLQSELEAENLRGKIFVDNATATHAAIYVHPLFDKYTSHSLVSSRELLKGKY